MFCLRGKSDFAFCVLCLRDNLLVNLVIGNRFTLRIVCTFSRHWRFCYIVSVDRREAVNA